MAALGGNDELTDLLRKTPVVLRALTASLDDATAYERDEGGWSVAEIVGHLIDAERRAIDRIAQLQVEDDPVLEGYDQTGMVEQLAYQSRQIDELLIEFERLRAERIVALEALGASGWERSATLSTYGNGTLRDITIHMCWHDANHLAQIARIRS